MFQTINFVSSNSVHFKYIRLTPLSCKDTRVIIFEFVGTTQFLLLTPDCKPMEAAACLKFLNKYLFCREKFENAKIMHFDLFCFKMCMVK